MTLDDHISKLRTCGNDIHCKLEESCFAVAQYAHEQRGRERLSHALARVEGVELPDDDDLVYFQPLDWERAR
jgi:hypothetical protein